MDFFLKLINLFVLLVELFHHCNLEFDQIVVKFLFTLQMQSLILIKPVMHFVNAKE